MSPEAIPAQVALVGAGPAGLAAAIELRRRGIRNVIVLERDSEAGGAPRHCDHPPYGMREFRRILAGPEYARRLRAAALAAGVDIRTRHTVVALEPGGRLQVVSPDRAAVVVADRVILATGAREMPRAAQLVSGDRPLGVLNTGALQGCLHLQGLRPFLRPVIVGSELVSQSAIWTCLRHGIRPVAVIEAGHEAVARWPFGQFPRLMGIPVHFRSHVTDILGAIRVERIAIATDAGRCMEIACDGVLFTGRFVPESALLGMSSLAADPASGGPSIDQFGRCSDPAYFAAGNALRPVETAGWCHREGRSVGGCVAQDLTAGLPPSDGAFGVQCGAGVKFAVPQRIVPSSGRGALTSIQLRISAAVRGRLTVMHEGRVLWASRGFFRPERRITIALRELRVPAGASSISVAIVDER